MKNTQVSAESMIAYLQSMMNDWLEEKAQFGPEDRIVQKKLDAMIACKSMVETLIKMPVNLQKDGKVTVGF